MQGRMGKKGITGKIFMVSTQNYTNTYCPHSKVGQQRAKSYPSATDT